MNGSRLAACALTVGLTACGGGTAGVLAMHSALPACMGSRIDYAQCDVLIEGGVHSEYSGWSAKDLETAYNLPVSKGKGQNVFVIDAFDNPYVASDFAAYRSGSGLPKGTLNKYNQDGEKGHYPPDSPGWGVEIDLDVEMASASCPKCTIDLVEANSNSWSDLEAAEEEAVKLGATIISNSFDGSGADESHWNKPGITYVASAGDFGYGVYDPAGFPRVIAVGGTSLSTDSGERGYTEVVWPETGGGCFGPPKPKWQKDPDCKGRTANDIAAVAVSAAEYDSFRYSGWITVDGTSIGAPLIAGMVGLAGNSTKQDGGKMLWTLSRAQQKKDVYAVTEGEMTGCPSSLSGTYLCEAGTGQFGIYSAPAGWGTPDGVGAL